MSESANIVKGHQIGSTIYREHPEWGKNFAGRDIKIGVSYYEGFDVVKLTAERVFVSHPTQPWRTFFLRRATLEKRGEVYKTFSSMADCDRNADIVGKYVLERPEEYVKQTLGYLLMSKPREVLGVGDKWTAAELLQSRNRLVRKYHPDSGSEPDLIKYQEAVEAYDKLKEGLSLGDLLAAAMEIAKEKRATP